MESPTMKNHPDCGKVRRKRVRLGARLLVMALAVTVTPACEGLLEVAADPHYVDASLNPAQLSETMVGALVDLNFAYDVWMYETNMFSGGMVALGLLRYTQSLRQQDRGGGQAGGLTGGGRDRRGPGVAYYAFLQQAIASSHAAQERILAGEFETISNPSSSAEFARVSVYNGFELVWLADFYLRVRPLRGRPGPFVAQGIRDGGGAVRGRPGSLGGGRRDPPCGHGGPGAGEQASGQRRPGRAVRVTGAGGLRVPRDLLDQHLRADQPDLVPHMGIRRALGLARVSESDHRRYRGTRPEDDDRPQPGPPARRLF